MLEIFSSAGNIEHDPKKIYKQNVLSLGRVLIELLGCFEDVNIHILQHLSKFQTET